jgi:hypothetical protein
VFAILPYLAHTPLLEGTNMREDQCVGQEEPEEKKVEGEEKPSLIDDLPRYLATCIYTKYNRATIPCLPYHIP